MVKRKRAPLDGVVDGHDALRASPSDETPPLTDTEDIAFVPSADEGDMADEVVSMPKKKAAAKKKKKKENVADEVAVAPKKKVAKKKDEEEEEEPYVRPPDVNSDYVPIPWKGRIGYACLNTYLRSSCPPIFCSRTCRIETILKHGGYGSDGKGKGMEYVQSLGLANARDLCKLIEWNERYGIRFLRISSEMFPFASHRQYGYDLDFAKPVLQEAGKLAMKYGHRLTTHPGQFTQLGSPRPEVIEASIRDLEFHSQLLRNLGLRGQADKDAVMILHMGGVFNDRDGALERFKHNYTTRLADDIKARLVLENDDVSWSVHDLLPVCQELNIPLVLDYHHHNIIHDPSLRGGTLDVMQLFPEIRETWTRKGITQKQHYSEPCPGANTGREMRKHSPRVKTLPPCADDMDLMIEAKDKEQAVFELYRKFGIFDGFKDVVPHERTDENRPPPARKKKDAEEETKEEVPEEEVGMGGEEGRVYWPEGKEEWLSPPKRVRKKKEDEENGDEISEPKKTTKRTGKVKVAAVKEEEEAVEPSQPSKRTKKPKLAVEKEDGEDVSKSTKRTRKTKAAPAVKDEDEEFVAPKKATKRSRKQTVAVKEEAGEEEIKIPNVKKSKETKAAMALEEATTITTELGKVFETDVTLPSARRRSVRQTKAVFVPPPTPSSSELSSPLVSE